jgi:hypothetical protein
LVLSLVVAVNTPSLFCAILHSANSAGVVATSGYESHSLTKKWHTAMNDEFVTGNEIPRIVSGPWMRHRSKHRCVIRTGIVKHIVQTIESSHRSNKVQAIGKTIRIINHVESKFHNSALKHQTERDKPLYKQR